MRVASLALVLGLAACAPVAQPIATSSIVIPQDATMREFGVRRYIKHVVIVVQENRTFDNLFHGFPGAHSAEYGYTHDGRKVWARPHTLVGPPLFASYNVMRADYDGGKMDGFDLTSLGPGAGLAGAYAYTYVERSEIEPYWTMASQYVLADRMFPTMFGGSFTGHLDLIASTSSLSDQLSLVDTPSQTPWGCDAPAGTATATLTQQRVVTYNAGPFPCLTQFHTLADTLDARKVSWKYYAPAVRGPNLGGRVWSEFDAIRNVRHGTDWERNVVSPPSRVLTDAASGKLPAVSWVIPDAYDSDHPGFAGDRGPSWVASVVNAIGSGPDWRSTAIVITWDDPGGWFDDVPPPQLDFRGLSMRVPAIVVSSYAKAHVVSHTQYEFGSIVRLVEEVFALPPLGPQSAGYTDTRANSLLDCFNFQRAPRAFVPIPAPAPASYFIKRAPSGLPPDDD